jgi:putative copper export protein
VFLATDVVVLALRALSFVALFQAAGAALFLWLFERDLTVTEERVRGLARRATYAAVTLTVLYHVLLPARMAGSFTSTFDPALESLLLNSDAGVANVLRVVALGLLVLAWEAPARLARPARATGVVLALASFAVMGHTAIHEQRWLLAPLLLVHVTVVAFWFGGLLPLSRVALREPAAIGAAVVSRFSKLASYTVPLILVAGIAMAVLFVRSWEELFTGYGAMIVGKTLAFGLLMALASLNRWRLVPALAAVAARAGQAVGPLAAESRDLRRTIAAEWIVIALVLVATALMTSLFAPENLHATFGEGH